MQLADSTCDELFVTKITYRNYILIMTEFIFNNVQYNIFPNWIIRIHIFRIKILPASLDFPTRLMGDLISACAAARQMTKYLKKNTSSQIFV